MSQTATQRTTGSTRLRGPAIITLRGAGAKGHDYKLGGVNPVGTGLDVGLSVQIPSGQTANAFQIEQPDGTVVAGINSSLDSFQSSLPNVIYGIRQVTLSTANITGMNGTPVAILPAPGANNVIYVDMITLQMKPGGTQFTGGGVVTFVYHGGSINPHASSIPAATINSASASNNILPPLAAVIQPPTNTGIDITNATGAFATGNGSAIVTIWYAVVTLG